MKILVVDDEQDIKTLFEQRFRKEIKSGQVEFIFSFSGEDALVQLNDWEHEAMLILSCHIKFNVKNSKFSHY